MRLSNAAAMKIMGKAVQVPPAEPVTPKPKMTKAIAAKIRAKADKMVKG